MNNSYEYLVKIALGNRINNTTLASIRCCRDIRRNMCAFINSHCCLIGFECGAGKKTVCSSQNHQTLLKNDTTSRRQKGQRRPRQMQEGHLKNKKNSTFQPLSFEWELLRPGTTILSTCQATEVCWDLCRAPAYLKSSCGRGFNCLFGQKHLQILYLNAMWQQKQHIP